MTQTTLLEKFKIIFEVSKSSKIFIGVIAFIILLTIISIRTNKKNAKNSKRIYAIMYAVILIALLVIYHNSLGKMFDYMMNNFFIVLYFPNVAVYLAAIIITNIILLISIFSFKTSKLVKNINIIVYGIIHYLLALVLNIITTNNLDIFSQISVYSNKQAQAIIELSSGIFIIWIIFLVVYKIIRKYQTKDMVPVRKKVVVKKVRALPENINEVPIPLFVKAQPRKEEKPKSKIEEPVIIGQIINENNIEKQELERQLEEAQEQLRLAEQHIKQQEEQIKIKDEQRFKLEDEQIKLEYENTKLHQEQIRLQQENKRVQLTRPTVTEVQQTAKVDATTAIMKNLDNMLTLEDYKILATMLKDKQKRKNEQKEQELNINNEQLKFAQLHEAYKNVR